MDRIRVTLSEPIRYVVIGSRLQQRNPLKQDILIVRSSSVVLTDI